MYKKILLTLFITFLFNGCQKSPQVLQDKKPPAIENKAYYLSSFGKTKMAVPKKAKILLRNGEYVGNAGCNGMGGKYEIDGNKIKFYSGISTMMACEDMSGETKFRKFLEGVNNWIVHKDKMILKIDDREVLNFKQR